MGVVTRRTNGTGLLWFAVIVLLMDIQGSFSISSEGLALLEFYSRIEADPHGTLLNWNPNDNDPCLWSGVYCANGHVEMLDLSSFSLEGELAPELGELIHLRSLLLPENRFVGSIPKEIGGLQMLEVLDLRDNNLSGTIPTEIGGLLSLKRLLICKNNIQGHIPLELAKLNFLTELQFDENLALDLPIGIDCVNRKFGDCISKNSVEELKKTHLSLNTIGGTLRRYITVLPLLIYGKNSLHGPPNCCDDDMPDAHKDTVEGVHKLVNIVRRRLFEGASNLAALPATGGIPTEQIALLLYTRSSGSFPAVPNTTKGQNDLVPSSPANPSSQDNNTTSQKNPSSGSRTWMFLGIGFGILVLLMVAAALYLMFRSRTVKTIRPWKTGLSGQLQKAFVTGVPKLNRAELETACEDFSNIIMTIYGTTVYKGTLSSGVEIGVVSVPITCAKDWTKRLEMSFRKKIHSMSRANHKNLINLLGYCEEETPFTRMMVFEYAPNGSLSEHIHVEESEHLDWSARMRIIMGIGYCLQYMHDLNPSVAYAELNSQSIFLTDDYAAKVAETEFWKVFAKSEESESKRSELPPFADPETNVYSFGVILLEIVSGKLPYSEEHGRIEDWAAEYLKDHGSYSKMVDPTLKSFKDKELEVICEVCQDCIQSDARKRPAMREVTSRLREVIAISPEAATPRLSPLWWAELEILSAES